MDAYDDTDDDDDDLESESELDEDIKNEEEENFCNPLINRLIPVLNIIVESIIKEDVSLLPLSTPTTTRRILDVKKTKRSHCNTVAVNKVDSRLVLAVDDDEDDVADL